jgi:enoyl-CoA hydratase
VTTTYQYIKYEQLDGGRIVRITLDRPHTRNAQNRGLIVELDEAFGAAETDDEVRVVILAGAGATFSSGHDLGSTDALREEQPGPDQHVSFRTDGGTRRGTEQRMLQEWHYYFANHLRWRTLRKITIAQTHGTVFTAGLMLMWACDLIVAAEDSAFADVVGARFGMSGVELFSHPWELGPRRAKELLLTGDALGADEAYRLGMVAKVFPLEELEASTLEFARRIARLPSMTSLLIKESVNQTLDTMGYTNALHSAFYLHQVNHSHWAEIHPDGVAYALESDRAPNWKTAPRVGLASRDTVEPTPIG